MGAVEKSPNPLSPPPPPPPQGFSRRLTRSDVGGDLLHCGARCDLLRVVPAQVSNSDRAARLAVLLSRQATDGIDDDQI
uniref:Uncharacterized protein n=1 Tax=Oryza meridionalis TaxID=40149 RepID=A0A0E0CJP5_9ORYZ